MSGVVSVQHLPAVIFILYPQTEMKAGIAPDLVIDDPCRFLCAQQQMDAQTASDAGNALQVGQKFAMLLTQLCKLINDQKQMSQRQIAVLTAACIFLQAHRRYVVPLHLLLKQLLTQAQLLRKRDAHALQRCLFQIRHDTADVRKITKRLRHRTAFVIDEKEAHLLRRIRYGQRQDVGQQQFTFARPCHAGNDSMGTVSFFMRIQRDPLSIFLPSQHCGQRMFFALCPLFQDRQLLHAAAGIQRQKIAGTRRAHAGIALHEYTEGLPFGQGTAGQSQCLPAILPAALSFQIHQKAAQIHATLIRRNDDADIPFSDQL